MARKFANPQVKLWSKRRKRFLKLKPVILSKVAAQPWTQAQALTFFATPSPHLKGRTPKQMMNINLILQLKKALNKLVVDYGRLLYNTVESSGTQHQDPP